MRGPPYCGLMRRKGTRRWYEMAQDWPDHEELDEFLFELTTTVYVGWDYLIVGKGRKQP